MGARHVKVRALPESGRPPDFSGGIGHFEVAAKASPTDVAVGDPLHARGDRPGKGNLRSLDAAGARIRDRVEDLPAGRQGRDARRSSASPGEDASSRSSSPSASTSPRYRRAELSCFDRITAATSGRRPSRSPSPSSRPPPRTFAGGGSSTTAASSGQAKANESSEFEIAPNQIALGRLRPSLEPLRARRRLFLALQLLPIALVVASFAWGAPSRATRRRPRASARDRGEPRSAGGARAGGSRGSRRRPGVVLRGGPAAPFRSASRPRSAPR